MSVKFCNNMWPQLALWALVLQGTVEVSADLQPAVWNPPSEVATCQAHDMTWTEHREADDLRVCGVRLSISEGCPGTFERTGDECRELPPLPESGWLFLYGMTSLGVWRAGRCARKLAWGTAPEWYHAGVLRGFGQVAPSDLLLHAALCPFQTSPGDHGSCRIRWEFIDESRRRFDLLREEAPRGPPICSLNLLDLLENK